MKKQLKFCLVGLLTIIFVTASLAQNSCDTDFTLNSPGDDISEQSLIYQANNLEANIAIVGSANVTLQGVTGVLLTNGFSVEEGSTLLAINDCTVNNNNIAKGLEFSVYPNPATDLLIISIEKSIFSNIELSVSNSFGQQVISNKTVSSANGYSQIQIDISNLPTGSYFVRFFGDNHVLSKQFVKL